MLKKVLGLLVLAASITGIKPADAYTNTASTVFSARLAPIVKVENTIIDGAILSRYDLNPEFKIRKIKQLDSETNLLELSDLQLKILSNSTNKISVSSDFSGLTGQSYTFPKASLCIYPKTIKLESGITPKFTPTVKLDPSVVPGEYQGVITFTISVL